MGKEERVDAGDQAGGVFGVRLAADNDLWGERERVSERGERWREGGS